MFRFIHSPLTKQVCNICNSQSILISAHIGVCLHCIREKPQRVYPYLLEAHRRTRSSFEQPLRPPRTQGGAQCVLCSNRCQIGENEVGFCGLRINRDGHLAHLAGTPQRGLLHWYRDPLPTNCVAIWVCGGRKRYGDHNLAVFYGSCVNNCLYCQNWHYRDMLPNKREIEQIRETWRLDSALSLQQRLISARSLADQANKLTYCVCFFGGDPASQMPHALGTASYLADQGVTICWETSGNVNKRLVDRAVDYSRRSGGVIKFDIKAFDETLHFALTGVSNQLTLENFARTAGQFFNGSDSPLVIASTLLVPGYVDVEEVGRIAQFIANIHPEIPYTLLAFGPHFYLHDLPTTSVDHAMTAKKAAKDAGLRNVRVANKHLLSKLY